MCQRTCSFDLSHSNQADNPNFAAGEAVAEYEKELGVSWFDLKYRV